MNTQLLLVIILGLTLSHSVVALFTSIWIFFNRRFRSRPLALLFFTLVLNILLVTVAFSHVYDPPLITMVLVASSLVVIGVGIYPVSYWLIFSRRTLFDSVVMDLINSFPDGVVITDFSEDQKVLFVNKKLEAMSGYDRDDLIGQSVDQLVPAASRGRHAYSRRSYRYDPITRPMGVGTFKMLCKNGDLKDVQISLSSRENQFIVAAIRET